MAYSNRPSRRPIPGICPCHGSAPHVLTKKSPTATENRRSGGKRPPRKGSAGQARPGFRSQRSGSTTGRRPVGSGSRR